MDVLESVRHRGGVSEQADRWTKATVYPDMWVNPDEDPRNSEGVSPDGELATARAAAARGVTYTLSVSASRDLADVAAIGGPTDQDAHGWRGQGHRRSTDRSRKWVAQEMQGS